MPSTILAAVSAAPEGNLRGSVCPVARIFTLVPPTSTTSTFIESPSSQEMTREPTRDPLPGWPGSADACLADLFQRRALRRADAHQLVPRGDERRAAIGLELRRH